MRVVSLLDWGHGPEATGSVADLKWSPDNRALAVSTWQHLSGPTLTLLLPCVDPTFDVVGCCSLTWQPAHLAAPPAPLIPSGP